MKFLLTTVLLFLSVVLQAQVDFSFRAISVTTTPLSEPNNGKNLTHIAQSKAFAFEPGLVLGTELFTDERTSFQFSVAGYYDKAQRISGFASLFLKYRVLKKYKHALSVGIGPTFFARQSWENISGYVPDDTFIENAGNQYKMAWLSGEISYNYYLSKQTTLYISALRTSPFSFGVGLGATYQLKGNKGRYGRRKKGCDCPSFR